MSSWLVAASVGAVEALKDQGFCRWNYALRLLQQRAKTNLKSVRSSSSSALIITNRQHQHHKLKQSEESMRQVMYFSSWATN